MGLRWHLVEYMETHGLSWPEVEERLGFAVGGDLRRDTPPIDLSLPIVADLCQALGCQPGDLLSWKPDDPAEQAERALAQDLSFQSFMAFKQSRDED
jgi:hypothetical protein